MLSTPGRPRLSTALICTWQELLATKVLQRIDLPDELKLQQTGYIESALQADNHGRLWSPANFAKAMQLTKFQAASMTYLSDSSGTIRFIQLVVSELT